MSLYPIETNIELDDNTYIWGKAIEYKQNKYYSFQQPIDEPNDYYYTKILDNKNTYIVYHRRLKYKYLWLLSHLFSKYNFEYDNMMTIKNYLYNYTDLYLYNNKLKKIVFTSIMRSDDYIKYSIKPRKTDIESYQVDSIIVTNKGGNSCTINIENNIIISKFYSEKEFDTSEYCIGKTFLINNILEDYYYIKHE